MDSLLIKTNNMNLKIKSFFENPIFFFLFGESFLKISPLKQISVRLHLFRFTQKEVIQNKFKGLARGAKKSQIKALLRGPPAAY